MEAVFLREPTQICPLQSGEKEEAMQDSEIGSAPASFSSVKPHNLPTLCCCPTIHCCPPGPHQKYPTLARSGPDWQTPPGLQMGGTGRTSHNDYVRSAHCGWRGYKEIVLQVSGSQTPPTAMTFYKVPFNLNTMAPYQTQVLDCQFQMRIVWSSEALRIHGYS